LQQSVQQSDSQIVDSENNSDSSEILEIHELMTMMQSARLPEELYQKGVTMISRLQKMIKYGSFFREYESIEKYISWITNIPWGKYSKDNLSLENVKSQLDTTHYGVENIKERMLEFIAMLNLINQREEQTQIESHMTSQMAKLEGSSARAPILCLVGIQGIGKTSIAKSISKALGRKFVRISLGGLAGVSEIRGRSRSEIDAEPGQIIKALTRSEVMNPMILLDEVDKISESNRADVMASLLEVLDPEQNSTFIDNFIDYSVDLSKVIFIATANNLGGISAALLDRLEVVRMISYNDDEKMHIARDFLLPKVLSNSGLLSNQVTFSDDVWPLIIRPLGFDAGIRELERTLTTIVRKIAKKIVTGEGTSFNINQENFREFIPEDIGVVS